MIIGQQSFLATIEMFVLFRLQQFYLFVVAFSLAQLLSIVKRGLSHYIFFRKFQQSKRAISPEFNPQSVDITITTTPDDSTLSTDSPSTLIKNALTASSLNNNKHSVLDAVIDEEDEEDIHEEIGQRTREPSVIYVSGNNKPHQLPPISRQTSIKLPSGQNLVKKMEEESVKQIESLMKLAGVPTSNGLGKTYSRRRESSILNLYFDPRKAHGIELWASVVADGASLFTASAIAWIYTAENSWAACDGLTSYLDVLYKFIFALTFMVSTQLVMVFCESRYFGFKVSQMVLELEKIRFGVRMYLCFGFMVCSALGLILAAETGVGWVHNSCFMRGRVIR
jgi:hypothetical protein